MLLPCRLICLVLLLLATLASGSTTAEEQVCSADGTCVPVNHECTDLVKDCTFWAHSGECTNNTPFMTKSCAFSCEFCQGGKLPSFETEEAACDDLHPKCTEWAKAGECVSNPGYMKDACSRSCLRCINIKKERDDGLLSEDEILRRTRFVHGAWGERQVAEGNDAKDKTQIKQILMAMQEYILQNVTSLSLQERRSCVNANEQCAFWAATDQCETNLDYMVETCPLACRFCETVGMYKKCHKLGSRQAAADQGDLESALKAIKGAEQVSETNDAWIFKLDDFISDKEADQLVEYVKTLDWKDSPTVDAGISSTGTVRRQSTSAYSKDRSDNKVYKKIFDKIAQLLPKKIDAVKHLEPIEFVHFDKMTSFGAHHDFRAHDMWMPAGPRILSFYLTLSDVKKGGARGFADLDWLYVPPKKGQLLVWSNTLGGDDDTMKRNPSMSNEELVIVDGEKYAIQTWLRLYDYNEAEELGCV